MKSKRQQANEYVRKNEAKHLMNGYALSCGFTAGWEAALRTRANREAKRNGGRPTRNRAQFEAAKKSSPGRDLFSEYL